MKNLNQKLTNFSVEKLEERKEFTFYFCWNPCHTHTPDCTDGGDGPGNGGN